MSDGWTRQVLEASLNLRAGERLVIMTDLPLKPQGEVLGAAAKAIGAADLLQVVLPGPEKPLALVPGALLAAVRQADVVVAMRSTLNLAAQDGVVGAALAAFRAEGRGRWASLAQISEEVLAGALRADLDPVVAEAARLAERLRAGNGVHLTSPAGTDLRLRYGGRPVHVEDGRIHAPGSIGNLPGGEVFVAPLESSAEGRLVVDLCLGDLALDGPVTLTFAGGRVVDLQGGEAATVLRRRLEEDPWAWTVGEFGLGANPHIRPSGKVALDEKALGTAHVALGGNRAFGGLNPAATHYDCVISGARVAVE